jgi:outer membrane protein insertion porin family
MNNFFRYALLVLLLGASHSVFALGPSQIKKIEIKQVGPQSVSESLIRANIRVKEGDNFSRLAVDDDVRNLYTTGYFDNIRIVEEPSAEGFTVTYVLVNKMRVTEIKFAGNTKYSVSKLKGLIKSKVGDPKDERKLFTDAQEIKKKYQNAGFPRTQVTYKIAPDENAGRATVTFEITETPKIRVTDVVFDGANAFKQRELRKQLKTKRWWMFSWLTQTGKLKDEELEDDKDKLQDFYRNDGYIDFELKEVKQELVKPNRMILHFVISEGQQYKVGAITFKGNSLLTTNDLSKVLKMHVGEIFTPKKLATDKEALEDAYGRKGYIDARVMPRRNPNVQTGTMDLVYEVTESEKAYIEKIEIKGNVKTKDKVIRRELAVAPGEVFDMVRVKRSKGRLEQMGYFERVDARPEDTDVPNRKNLVVGVDEKNTGNFTVGAGFSSVDSLVGFVEVSQGNFDLFKPPTFTGGGQKFRMRAAVGTLRQDFQVSFVEPWFMDQKLALGVDLYYRQLSFLSSFFDERRIGGKMSLTRALGSDFLIGTVSYTPELVGIQSVDPRAPQTMVNSEGDYFLNRFAAAIAYDTRNSATLPSRGHRSELVGEFVAGDANIYKIEAKTAWFFPGFSEGHVLELRVKGGVVEAWGGSNIREVPAERTPVGSHSGQPGTKFKNLPNNDVPFFERWYLGGAYSLRGFRYRDAGPQEHGIKGVSYEPVGGNTYYLGTAEYSLPIIERLRFAVFYDIGNVFYGSYDFSTHSAATRKNGKLNEGWYSSDAGVGIRLNLPIGPLRFDYAVPMQDAYDSGGGGRFNFTVGYTTEF